MSVDFVERHALSLLLALVAVSILLLVALVLWDSWSHRDQVCARSHYETVYVQTGSGPGSVLMPVTSQVCDSWRPKE